jgi:hypothetical protein
MRYGGNIMLKEFALGAEAVTYIRSELVHGHTFARLLLDLPLEEGYVMTYLPTTIDDKTLYRFEGGVGKASSEILLHETVLFVSRCLSKNLHGYAIFEGYRPSESILAASNRQYFFYGSEETYYFSSTSVLEQVENAARGGRSYPYVGALTSLSEDQPSIQTGTEVPREILEELAAQTTHIIVGAYDDEGYLIWTRGQGE